MELENNLRDLKLYYLSENLKQFIANASKSKFSLQQALKHLVELELVEKANRSTQQRLKTAKIGNTKPMAEFDWAWPKEIDRAVIEDLIGGSFIEAHQNLVFAGSQGVGKTMIAKNIALQAISTGHRVVFTSAAGMVLDLSRQESSIALQRRIKRYISPGLLVIDEIGYLSFDNRSADLLFEVVSQRYEKGSIIVTTNLAFKDWGNIFQGSACTTAIIDRLTHHCRIIKITADSYRTMESNKEAKKRSRKK